METIWLLISCALLGSVYFYDGGILFVDAAIAMAEACCCGGGVISPDDCEWCDPDTTPLRVRIYFDGIVALPDPPYDCYDCEELNTTEYELDQDDGEECWYGGSMGTCDYEGISFDWEYTHGFVTSPVVWISGPPASSYIGMFMANEDAVYDLDCLEPVYLEGEAQILPGVGCFWCGYCDIKSTPKATCTVVPVGTTAGPRMPPIGALGFLKGAS